MLRDPFTLVSDSFCPSIDKLGGRWICSIPYIEMVGCMLCCRFDFAQDMASELRIDLDAKYTSLKNELDFVTKMQEELSTLQSKLCATAKDTSVLMIKVDTGKSFGISTALNKIRMEYEKSVQSVSLLLQVEEIQTATAKSSEAVSEAKMEMSGAWKELQALSLEFQCLVTSVRYHAQFSSLMLAIEVAKTDLHNQILAYHELLDVKLALDVEISTNRNLLEGDNLKEIFTATSYSFSGERLFKQGYIVELSSVQKYHVGKYNKKCLSHPRLSFSCR
uniref:Zgc:136930 n=1 Tax=Salmo trutta TaxID=8032 RepID=A0A674C6F8_SALTR